MKTITLIAIAATALMTGCSSAPTADKAPASTMAAGAPAASGATIKKYPVHAKVISVDAPAKKARLEAGAIGDWMGPMTMNYTIKDDAGLAQLKEGSEIDGTVNVDGDDNFWLTDIKVTK